MICDRAIRYVLKRGRAAPTGAAVPDVLILHDEHTSRSLHTHKERESGLGSRAEHISARPVR